MATRSASAPGERRSRTVLWLSAGTGALLAIVAIASLFIVSRELRAARDSHNLVQHTRDVLDSVQRLLLVLQDAETGERGFVITGKEAFLQPYDAAERTLEGLLHSLDTLIADPVARLIFADIDLRSHEQMAFLRHVVEQRRAGATEISANLIAQELGRHQMDELRRLVTNLEMREKLLLDTRLKAFRERSIRSERTAQGALGLAVLLALLAGMQLLVNYRRRLIAEVAALGATQLLRSTLNNVTQGVAVYDDRQQLKAWNDRYLELCGLTPTEVRAGLTPDQLANHAEPLSLSMDGVTQEMQVALPLLTSGAQAFEAEVTRASGVTLQVSSNQIPNGDYVVTLTDVTAVKLSEMAYRDQATRHGSTLDSIADAIVTIDEGGNIESWSKGARSMFGYVETEVLRRNVKMLMPEPHASAHDGYLRKYIETGDRRIMGKRRELEALHRDGHRFPIELSISEMHLGSRRQFIGTLRDISERVEVERLKSGFVSTVSHELRTPLTSISGSLGLLAGGVAGALPPKVGRLIEIAHSNCDRLVRLVNDILDLEKAESGKLEFVLERLPLKHIVQQAIDVNRGYSSFGVIVELEAPEQDATVLADRDRLIQVLTNLLSNAAKFSPRDAVVKVRIHKENDSACIEVQDQGQGISPEFEKRIFQKFAQADTSDTRAKGGTGLGLSISKTLIERLGGSIGFRNQRNQGATFFVTLPLHRAADQSTETLRKMQLAAQ